jgi:RNA polymerase sigma-70 factor (ECF subfamily)
VLARREAVDVREPRAYLSSIARGLMVDFWRRQDVERAYQEAIAQLPEGRIPSPEARLLMLETLISIDKLLDTLKPRSRTAFLLAQLEGLTIKQIAERLSVSHATVERDLAKALRCCYAAQFGDAMETT